MVRPISEIRRPEIVRATIDALGKKGLPQLSYDTIAGEADMSRQLIRHYFPDPEELMVSVCDALAALYKDLLTQGILEANTAQRLPMFLDFYFGLAAPANLRKPQDDQVYDALMSLAAGSDAVKSSLRDQYQLLQFTVAHEVQISHPGLSQRACAEIGYLFVSLMYGHWKMVASLGFDPAMNAVSRSAMDRIIQSYLDRYDDPDTAEKPLPPEGAEG